MLNFTFKINIEDIAKELNVSKRAIEAEVNEAVRNLALGTFYYVQNEATSKLRMLRQKYLDNLYFQEYGNVWVVALTKQALFIENGMRPHSQVPILLKRKYKVALDGSKYRAIPIGRELLKQGSMDPRAQAVFNLIKREFKKRNIPFRKIETDAYGRPKLGILHRLNLSFGLPSPRADYDLLHGLTVIQRKEKRRVIRELLTFRTVSTKHEGYKWMHPGLQGVFLLDKAYEWALSTWDSEVLPALMQRLQQYLK